MPCHRKEATSSINATLFHHFDPPRHTLLDYIIRRKGDGERMSRLALLSSYFSCSRETPCNMPQQKPRRTKRPSAHDGEEPSRKKLKLTKQAPMENLPADLLCQVLSYLGPASTGLVALSEANKFMNKTMNAIGNAMLPRAQINFRVPLEPKSPTESFTSLFVRHARTCSGVLNQLTELRLRLNQTLVDAAVIDQAMDMALDLLEVGPVLSVSLERQILSTAGKCGGKAFKFCKGLMLQNAEETNVESRSNQERLDMARLIMQLVVFRDCNTNFMTRLVQKQTVRKKTISMDCF